MFVKGVSGNPKGRPKQGITVEHWMTAIKKYEKKNRVNFIAETLEMSRTDATLRKAVLDRISPIPKQPMDINLSGELKHTLNLQDYGFTNESEAEQYARELLAKRKQTRIQAVN